MKFDRKDFDILKCAQHEEFGYINDERAFDLMRIGLLEFNPREKWHIDGYKSTKKGTQQYLKWLSEIRTKHGHEWETNDNGDIDLFAFSAGQFHNGPRCKKCSYGYCMHCTQEYEVDTCGNANSTDSYDDSKLDKSMVALSEAFSR